MRSGTQSTGDAGGFLIGLDLGTSTIKGVLVDRSGKVLAQSSRLVQATHPRSGWVELEPEQHYRDVCGVIRQLAEASPGRVAAVAMAAASGNTLLATNEGQPVTPIISWLDQRGVECAPAALKAFTVDEVRQVSGWPCVMSFPLAHLAWYQENREEDYRRCGKFCMNTDWLLHRLTGRWVMDYSTATTFHLFNQTTRGWHEPFLQRLAIDPRRLSTLAASGTAVGPLSAQAILDTGLSATTMVVAGCFDHPAAARAVGAFAPHQLLLSAGTSWVGFFPEPDRERLITLKLLCDPYLAYRGGPWGGIFSVPAIGRTIDAYIQQVIAPGEAEPHRIFDDSAAEATPGAGGLVIDLREGVKPLQASRANISRAVMESAARLLNGKLQELAGRGIHFTAAVMTGGPSRSPVWPGIVESMTGLHLSVGSQHAGAFGAALLAGIGAGYFKDEQEAFSKAGEHHEG